LDLNADGTFVYTPDAGFRGTDQFTYTANDGTVDSNVATATIIVDDAPVAVADQFTGAEDAPLTVPAPGILANDFDADGDPRTIDNGVSIAFHTPGFGEFWSTDFAAPDGATLVPGTYEGAVRFPFQGPGQPGLDISGDGRGSNTLTGRFTVLRADYDAAGNVI